MRIVLDTDVSSLLLKRRLPRALLARIAPHQAAITFATVYQDFVDDEGLRLITAART